MKNDYLIGLFVYQDAAEYFQVGDVSRILINEKIDSIFDCIEKNRNIIPRVAAGNIPEFSCFDEVDNVLSSLFEAGVDFTSFVGLGGVICKAEKASAKGKYGENHYKLTALLGLASKTFPMRATELGRQYYRNNLEDRENLLAKLILRIPVIQQLLIMAGDEYVDVKAFLSKFLAPSTVKRRESSIKSLINKLIRCKSVIVRERASKLIW